MTMHRTVHPTAYANGRKRHSTRFGWSALLASSSLLVIATASSSLAQSTSSSTGGQTQVAQVGGPEVEEVTVTARRRAENIQKVPLVVNAVTSEELNKLQIRNLSDITSVVPGLVLRENANGIGVAASLRGIDYNINTAGNNGTIQFYMDDQPMTGSSVVQSMYDIQQIEVLHGPQGTLRGEPSPSGSITITTRLPDLDEWGGYADVTATNYEGENINGAASYPIIPGILAVRVAGLFSNNEANEVRSVFDPGQTPYSRTDSERVTLRFDPSDNLEIIGTYQNFRLRSQVFSQVESASLDDPTLVQGEPAAPVAITPFKYQADQYHPDHQGTDFANYNLRAEWRFAGQKLDYVGGWNHYEQFQLGGGVAADALAANGLTGNPFIPNNPSVTGGLTSVNFENADGPTKTNEDQFMNELRLSSDEPLWGRIDYVIGILDRHESDLVDNNGEQPLTFNPGSSLFGKFLITQTIESPGTILERSAYANVNLHIDDATELSAGARYINFESHQVYVVNVYFAGLASPVAVENLSGPGGISQRFGPIIYTASLKHNFNDNILGYISTGSSFRPDSGSNVLQFFGDVGATGFVRSMFDEPPEKSTSYEAGLKTEWLDKSLLANLTYYHQDFSNYIYPVSSIYESLGAPVGSPPVVTPTAGQVPEGYVGVPVTVNGVEGEVDYQPLPNWSIDANASYSAAVTVNATIPCDTAEAFAFQKNPVAQAATFLASNGGQQIALCFGSNVRAGSSPPFNAQVQSEYFHNVTDRFDGFVRGLAQIYGYSKGAINDLPGATPDVIPIPDAVPAYATFNLYAGVRDPGGLWSLTFYGKNIFDVQRVLTIGQAPNVVSSRTSTLVSAYRSITTTAPAEFGVNLHIALGGG